ncbi:hypothetical protein POM88_023173 [Heracleum sosnowskyi]|uniref:Uncharacterized protein n=1 Tax=Heracleum sosnowskyi TaxID=360622 RepID=A0AAD8IIZ0_9APIA|nr:hypothetical protein POM88_023173 [Heracleum sosnowskyi]
MTVREEIVKLLEKADMYFFSPEHPPLTEEAQRALDWDIEQKLKSACNASLQFHVINIRTDIEFVFFSGGFVTPCILKRSTPRAFANPNTPLYGHLSSIDSTGNSMRVTWVSGDKSPQQVQYGNGKSETSTVTTFSQDDMCSSVPESPAKDFGWHDPGYIHSAVMRA